MALERCRGERRFATGTSPLLPPPCSHLVPATSSVAKLAARLGLIAISRAKANDREKKNLKWETSLVLILLLMRTLRYPRLAVGHTELGRPVPEFPTLTVAFSPSRAPSVHANHVTTKVRRVRGVVIELSPNCSGRMRVQSGCGEG